MTASHALSQLSYGPKNLLAWKSASDVRAMIEENLSGFKRCIRNPTVREGASITNPLKLPTKNFLPQKTDLQRSASEDH